MKKASRWKDGDQGDSKVVVQSLVLWFKMDGGMTQWIAGGLVDPGVQGRHIHVKDLLPQVNVRFMVKCHGTGSSAKEGIAGLKGWCGSHRRKKRGKRRCRGDLLFPLALPLDNDLKACIAEAL